MLIGERLRELREAKKLSQGDIEERTGLLRCYISRIENCHTVPALETLEKLARALEVPIYALFHGIEHSSEPMLKRGKPARESAYERRMVKLLARMDERQRELLLDMAQQMARR